MIKISDFTEAFASAGTLLLAVLPLLAMAGVGR